MIVLARKVKDVEFVEWAGKYYDTPVFKTIWKAESLVYSSDDGELGEAKKFAKLEGYRVFCLPDTADILSIAKQMILETRVRSK